MENTHAGLTLAIALAAGVLAQSVAKHLRIPSILLLLVLGFGLGPNGLDWVAPYSLGSGLYDLVDFAVAIILFEGGLNLEASRLRRQELPIRQLISIGALVSFLGATISVLWFLDWSLPLAFLFGSLVVVTGPTVIGPLLRDMRLRPHMKTILEAEGVFIDPIGALLAILVLHVALSVQTLTILSETVGLIFRVGFGLIMGIIGGFLLGKVLRVRFLLSGGFTNIFTLAAVFLLFHVSDHVISQSGILAVTIAGVVMGNFGTPVDRDLRDFKDQLTILLVGMLFILLAATIRWEDVQSLGMGSFYVLVSLIFVIRPLNVWVSTRGSTLTWQKRVFIGWVAPRGIVAAAIASITAGILNERGLDGGSQLMALVFLTIAGTVGLSGITAQPLASLLELRLSKRDRIAILGAEGLGIALGQVFRDQGLNVVYLDSDPKRCHQAEEAGFSVVFGDALQERTLLRAQMELVGTSIGLTPNEHLNSMFIDQTHNLFGVPEGFVALESLEGDKIPEHIQRHDGKVLFESPHDIERWAVRTRHNDLDIDHFVYQPPLESIPDKMTKENEPPAAQPGNNDRFVILAIRRKTSMVPMSLDYELKEGDLASVAIYRPERDQALQTLHEGGWALTRSEAPEGT